MIEMNRREALRRIALGTGALAMGAATHVNAQPAGAGATMHRRRIPTSGEMLPVIGIGTWQTFDVGPSDGDRAPLGAVLGAFAQMGGTVIDSSPMYGRAEEVAGDLIASLGVPAKPFIATKVWTSGKETGVRQMRESMRKLRVKTCDLMQVHNLLDVEAHLDTLAEWKQRGLVRYDGVTHYTASGAQALAQLVSRRPVDFVQINYSVEEREAEKRLLPLCRERGIAVIANRPFAGGAVFRKVRGRPVPEWASEIDCRSWAQLMLKFIIGHPAITCAIPASGKVEHIRDNMGGGYGRLPEEAMRRRIAEEIGRL